MLSALLNPSRINTLNFSANVDSSWKTLKKYSEGKELNWDYDLDFNGAKTLCIFADGLCSMTNTETSSNDNRSHQTQILQLKLWKMLVLGLCQSAPLDRLYALVALEKALPALKKSLDDEMLLEVSKPYARPYRLRKNCHSSKPFDFRAAHSFISRSWLPFCPKCRFQMSGRRTDCDPFLLSVNWPLEYQQTGDGLRCFSRLDFASCYLAGCLGWKFQLGAKKITTVFPLAPSHLPVLFLDIFKVFVRAN